MTSYNYARTSLLAGGISWLVQHQPELAVIATCVSLIAGVVSIIKSLKHGE